MKQDNGGSRQKDRRKVIIIEENQPGIEIPDPSKRPLEIERPTWRRRLTDLGWQVSGAVIAGVIAAAIIAMIF